ncbi:hypothetical protein CHELA40_15163 [Chelatococcus asaccharovorans]|nr:hypothetical protein CHELA40_15163 [Chelatococcus asaccharovorans]
MLRRVQCRRSIPGPAAVQPRSSAPSPKRPLPHAWLTKTVPASRSRRNGRPSIPAVSPAASRKRAPTARRAMSNCRNAWSSPAIPRNTRINRSRRSEAKATARLRLGAHYDLIASDRRSKLRYFKHNRIDPHFTPVGLCSGAFSSEVDTGSREENALKQRHGAFSRFGETRKCSSARTPG